MKSVIVIWVLAIIAAVTVGGYIDGSMTAAAATVVPCEPGGVHICPDGPAQPKCPDGEYLIGVGPDGVANCHLNPTGCYLGDSIPMDQCVDKSQQSSPIPVTNTPQPVVPDGPAYSSAAYNYDMEHIAK